MNESISIGIVTYNSRDRIRETIDSLLEHPAVSADNTIYVFDNCSTDGTLELLAKTYAGAKNFRLISSSRNLGFAEGNNRILGQVDSMWHCFCNPDIRVTEGALDRLLDRLRADVSLGIVSPKFLFDDGALQPLNKKHPTVLDLLIRRFGFGVVKRFFSKRIRNYEMHDIGYDAPCAVPFASGAFMMCRTDVLRSVGGFDKRYFLYFEDADLSREVQKAGWKVLYEPYAVVYHGWRREAHRSMRGMRLFAMSACAYFNKWGWKLF